MIERRIKGRVTDCTDTLDDFFFTLTLEGDDKGRRVSAHVPRVWRVVCALLRLAWLKDYTVSMIATYEERNGEMLVYETRGFKVEDDK